MLIALLANINKSNSNVQQTRLCFNVKKIKRIIRFIFLWKKMKTTRHETENKILLLFCRINHFNEFAI
jgi:hypothetical protein